MKIAKPAFQDRQSEPPPDPMLDKRRTAGVDHYGHDHASTTGYHFALEGEGHSHAIQSGGTEGSMRHDRDPLNDERASGHLTAGKKVKGFTTGYMNPKHIAGGENTQDGHERAPRKHDPMKDKRKSKILTVGKRDPREAQG